MPNPHAPAREAAPRTFVPLESKFGSRQEDDEDDISSSSNFTAVYSEYRDFDDADADVEPDKHGQGGLQLASSSSSSLATAAAFRRKQHKHISVVSRISSLLGRTTRTVSRSARSIPPRSQPARIIFFIAVVLGGGLLWFLWLRESAIAAPWVPDAATQKFAQEKSPLPPPSDNTSITSYTLPLRASGRDIVDVTGRRFKLLSVNWYGASDELFVPGGLDVRHRDDIAATIRRLGFNSVRLPYSDEMVVSNPVVDAKVVSANPDLVGARALDVLEACSRALTGAGVAVIVNNHITHATWCCGADPCDSGWRNDHLSPPVPCRVRQTEEDWIQNWVEVMRRLADDPLVIGADLRNEVRGLWGTMPWRSWAAAAERAGNRLLRINRDWLVVVGGTESNNDLSGVTDRPVVLDVPGRVVYSAHVYAWSGWGSVGGRFSRRAYGSFARAMHENWAYLIEGDVAPVWVGEFGASHRPSVGGANYWRNLMRFLGEVDADFGYWAINPRKPKDNVKESYSLVEDDWVTPMLDYRMRDLQELMAAAE